MIPIGERLNGMFTDVKKAIASKDPAAVHQLAEDQTKAGASYLDVNVGLVYVVAITSLSVLAVWMAGWSSNNHYALLGAMRTVAMMVSYEIPVSISLLSVVLFARGRETYTVASPSVTV